MPDKCVRWSSNADWDLNGQSTSSGLFQNGHLRKFCKKVLFSHNCHQLCTIDSMESCKYTKEEKISARFALYEVKCVLFKCLISYVIVLPQPSPPFFFKINIQIHVYGTHFQSWDLLVQKNLHGTLFDQTKFVELIAFDLKNSIETIHLLNFICHAMEICICHYPIIHYRI